MCGDSLQLQDLPDDILLEILSKAPVEDVLRLRQVNSVLYATGPALSVVDLQDIRTSIKKQTTVAESPEL